MRYNLLAMPILAGLAGLSFAPLVPENVFPTHGTGTWITRPKPHSRSSGLHKGHKRWKRHRKIRGR